MLVNPKVSVVIPRFNNGDFINEALESVLSKTFSDVEILVIDDRLTGNTKKVLARL